MVGSWDRGEAEKREEERELEEEKRMGISGPGTDTRVRRRDAVCPSFLCDIGQKLDA